MKMLSKKWIIAAVVMAIICFAAIPVFAEENVIQISSDLSLIQEGDVFEVTVTYGGNFNGVDMRLSYNGDLLAIEDEGSGITNAIISDHENTVYMNASAVNAMSAKNGNMLTVCFKAKEGQSGHGDIALTIKDLFLNDADYNPVDLNYEIRNEIENQGGVDILSREEKENETISVVKTPGGTAQITGLPENTTSVFQAVIGIAAILLILAGILIYKKVKKDKKSQKE